jgi:DNA-binding transcriptional MerR regulator
MSNTEPEPTPASPDVSNDERLFGIAQVSRIIGLKPFVLRYWESEFPMLGPVKGKTGHRLYRQQDVDLVRKIKTLLYDEGFTIAGARRHLEELAATTNGNGEESHQPADEPPSDQTASGAPVTTSSQSSTARETSDDRDVHVDRMTLLELRDSLRGFLTLLERK